MKFRTLAFAASAFAACATAALAHHAVNSQFDITKNLTTTGTLVRVELINPHTYMYFKVNDGGGKSHDMAMETGAPIALKRAGLSIRDSMKPGENYKLFYSPARNGNASGLLTAITLPDGRFIAFGGQQNIDAAKALNK